MMDTQKVYVILVALTPDIFDHYCTEPQIFYDSYSDAEEILKRLVASQEFNPSQLKIQQLWRLKNKHS